jgi:tetratricopeptide (TPR) repeat protein
MCNGFLGKCTPRILIPLLFILGTAIPGQGQQATIDLNSYYRFPLSLGVEYQSMTPLVSYQFGSPYTLFDLGLTIRWPIPPLPMLQPAMRAGMTQFDSQSQSDPLKWDHTDIYGLLGLEYAHRFAKNFEIGANLFGGVSESLYYNLVPGASGPQGNLNLLMEAGARLSLDPSYNFTIEVHPNLRYLFSLGELPDFNGPVFGIGFTANFRFGQDPDSPQTQVRAIRFEKANIPNAFAALQSWYSKNRIGTVTLVNTEKASLTDVEVSCYQQSYMDSPTPGSKIPELKPGQSVEAELFAMFNDKVFAVEGVTPLNGEVIVSYKLQGRSVEQRQSVSFDLYDKRAIVWNDDRKVSALITPDDSALKNYGGYIRQACRGEATPGFSDALQLSMQVYNALGELGCLYQANTLLPFTKVQGNPAVVDTVHLARETLKSGLGDCSDLTVAFDSILESLAVDTGFVTVPGHIYAAVNTKVPTKDYRKVHPDRGMTLDVNGELWVPVEITLIGKAGFMEAWRKGMEEWTALESTPKNRAFYVTKQARELYRPVGLKEVDLGLQYGRKEALVSSFQKDRDKLMELIAADQLAAAKASGKKADWNKAGIMYAQFMQFEKARQAFQAAIAIDSGYISAYINLGNLLFLQQRYDDALTAYQNARKTLDPKAAEGKTLLLLLINISRVYYQTEKFDQAKDFYGQAQLLDAGAAKDFAYLAEKGTSGARAAEQGDPGKEILFSEE